MALNVFAAIRLKSRTKFVVQEQDPENLLDNLVSDFHREKFGMWNIFLESWCSGMLSSPLPLLSEEPTVKTELRCSSVNQTVDANRLKMNKSCFLA